jgi:hypothetical protein
VEGCARYGWALSLLCIPAIAIVVGFFVLIGHAPIDVPGRPTFGDALSAAWLVGGGCCGSLTLVWGIVFGACWIASGGWDGRPQRPVTRRYVARPGYHARPSTPRPPVPPPLPRDRRS